MRMIKMIKRMMMLITTIVKKLKKENNKGKEKKSVASRAHRKITGVPYINYTCSYIYLFLY